MRQSASAPLIAVICLVAFSCNSGPSASPGTSGGYGSGSRLTERMSEAAFSGNRRAVETMLADVNVNATDAESRTMLMLASFGGHATTVRLLCENKANPNMRDSNRRTALMYAASGPNAPTVEILLAHGAEVNITDGEEGWTALMFAAAEGHADIVRMLLAKGADPNLMDIDGESALTFAQQQGHADVVAILGGSISR